MNDSKLIGLFSDENAVDAPRGVHAALEMIFNRAYDARAAICNDEANAESYISLVAASGALGYMTLFAATAQMRDAATHTIGGVGVAIKELSRTDRFRGGIYGLLVGDALGVPYEFHDASEIPEEPEIEMTPPKGFRRAHAGVPIGTWSDDGAQALCLLNSLTRDTSLDLPDFARQLVAWYETGHLTPDGRVFDVGMQTRRALDALRKGVDASRAGPSGERDNGNGALMRCLPVVFVAKSPDNAIELAMRQGIVTHAHVRSQLCCALYALTGAALLDGLTANEAVNRAESEFRLRFEGTECRPEMQLVLSARGESPRGSGYVVDSLWSSINCLLTTSSYETCVRRAIALGNDTDTTACIAGGLAGMLYGYDHIPLRWLEVLRGRNLVEGMLAKF